MRFSENAVVSLANDEERCGDQSWHHRWTIFVQCKKEHDWNMCIGMSNREKLVIYNYNDIMHSLKNVRRYLNAGHIYIAQIYWRKRKLPNGFWLWKCRNEWRTEKCTNKFSIRCESTTFCHDWYYLRALGDYLMIHFRWSFVGLHAIQLQALFHHRNSCEDWSHYRRKDRVCLSLWIHFYQGTIAYNTWSWHITAKLW